jgi:hypothetical protein
MTWVLRLTSDAVAPSRGDLGDVGCASGFDSVARANNGGELPEDLILVPGRDDELSETRWEVPASCEVEVIIGQINDYPVYLNGEREGGAGPTMVSFTGESGRQKAPTAGIDTLTLPSTAYWVPELAPDEGNPLLYNLLLAFSGAAFIVVAGLVWRAIGRRRSQPIETEDVYQQ